MPSVQDTGISGYLARLTTRIGSSSLSDECRALVRQHMLDGLACSHVGRGLHAFGGLTALCGRNKDGCGWPGCGDERANAADGAMVWAYAINGSVYEDGSREGACHPAGVVVPAVVALGGEKSWDLIDRAVVAGYDVMVRIARCGNPHFSMKGFHPTSISAPFGAAATASVLLGHDEATTRNALGIAALGSSGLMAAFKCGPTQPLQVAWGARNGINAALLAAGGNPGYPRILEDGFFRAYLGHDPVVPVQQLLDYEYAISGSYLKAHPGCRHLHPCLDAFDSILREDKITHEEVEAVRVGTYRIAVETEIHELMSRGDAYFNIPYALAARAVLGRSNYDAFDEKHFGDEKILRFMKKVQVRIDPEVDGSYPGRRGAVVEVDIRGGGTIGRKVEHPLGEPENPLHPSATVAKLRDAAGGFLSERQMERVESILDITGPSEPAGSLFLAACGSR